jgi:Ca2+-transporting ATPase
MDPSDPNGLDHARTVAFTAVVVYQLFNVLNCRSDESSIFSLGITSNRYVLGAITGTFLIHLVVVYYEPVGRFFHTVSLGLFDWVLVFIMATTIVLMNEVLVRLKNRSPDNGMAG